MEAQAQADSIREAEALNRMTQSSVEGPRPTVIPTNVVLTDGDIIERVQRCSELVQNGGELTSLKQWLVQCKTPDLNEMGTEVHWNSLLRACVTRAWHILHPDSHGMSSQEFDATHPRTMCRLVALFVKMVVKERINKRLIQSLKAVQEYNAIKEAAMREISAYKLEAAEAAKSNLEQNTLLQQRLYLLRTEKDAIESDYGDDISELTAKVAEGDARVVQLEQQVAANTQAFQSEIQRLEAELTKKTLELSNLSQDKTEFQTTYPETTDESPSDTPTSDSFDAAPIMNKIMEAQRIRNLLSHERAKHAIMEQDKRSDMKRLEEDAASMGGRRANVSSIMDIWKQREQMNK